MVRPFGFPEVLFSRGPLFREPPPSPSPELPPDGGYFTLPPPPAGVTVVTQIFGTDNSDELYVDLDRNLIWGYEGDDFAYGYKGDDTIKGRKGNDYLKGGCGDDKLRGSEGDDTLKGGYGNDILYSGGGNDLLLGGGGSDTFKTYGSGGNVIKDFSANDGGRIVLKSAIFDSIA